MFQNRTPLMYCKFTKDGKVTVDMGKNEDGTRKTAKYDHLVGKVKSIEYAESTYQNEKIKSWKIKIEGDSGTALLTVGHSSSFTKGLINCLANADLTKPLQFGCYMKNDYLQPSLLQNGDIVRWKFPEMPKSNKVEVGSKTVYDDTPVVEWLDSLIFDLNAKLKSQAISAPQDVINEDFDTEEKPIELNDLPF